MNSSVHRPRNVPCQAQYLGCTQYFVSRSAMISHLENGRCPSGADRALVDRWVRLRDSDNVVTLPDRFLTNGDSDYRYYATEQAWDGSAYVCMLCHNRFRTLDDLNRHLASPKHQERAYHCPLSSCFKMFTTLSALCRHVESESCGALKIRAVQEGMDEFFNNMRRLTF